MKRSEEELRRALFEDLTVGKYEGGKLLGFGRQATDAEVEKGGIPVIGNARIQRVPTAWLRRKLQVEKET